MLNARVCASVVDKYLCLRLEISVSLKLTYYLTVLKVISQIPHPRSLFFAA
jgi:hypothetical protein